MRIKRPSKKESYAVEPDPSVALARLFNLDNNLDAPPGLLPLHNNDDALAWRLTLIEQAENTIDAQYYSWHTDISGTLLIKKLIEAADRGVRVRLLLDDIDTFGTDRQIATMNYHPNIEVRIFNPFKIRATIYLLRVLELLWSLDRLTHRMHNKLLVSDNAVSIIGGRNIGDEYFGLSSRIAFRDLDLLVSGSSVSELSASFDLFWNHEISKPAKKLIAFRPKKLDFSHLLKTLDKKLSVSHQILQRINNKKTELLEKFDESSSVIKSISNVYYDPPDAIPQKLGHLAHSLYKQGATTLEQLIVVSAYFVPSEALITSFKYLLSRGVKISVYTNSLSSIDVTAAFSGYQRYRFQLLQMGVELFEFCSNPKYRSVYTTPSVNVKRYSLHAKSIIYDSNSVYVGTLNIDPRSSKLNTEIGLLVQSSQLARSILDAFNADLAEGEFWRLSLNPNGKITWKNGTTQTHIQPARNVIQRLFNFIYSFLPIHQQL